MKIKDIENIEDCKNPFHFMKLGWPDYRIYKEQELILESLMYDDETWVPAGNML